MAKTRQKIRAWGNSLGILLPKTVTSKAGLAVGDEIVLKADKQGFSVKKKEIYQKTNILIAQENEFGWDGLKTPPKIECNVGQATLEGLLGEYRSCFQCKVSFQNTEIEFIFCLTEDPDRNGDYFCIYGTMDGLDHIGYATYEIDHLKDGCDEDKHVVFLHIDLPSFSGIKVFKMQPDIFENMGKEHEYEWDIHDKKYKQSTKKHRMWNIFWSREYQSER